MQENMFTKKDLTNVEGMMYLYQVALKQSKRAGAASMLTSNETFGKYLECIEYNYGVSLLSSNGRGSHLTPEGEFLVEKAEEILKILREADTLIANKNEVRGTVRLAITEGISLCVMPEGLGGLFQQYPNLSIYSTCTDELPNLNNMEADVIVAYDYPETSKVIKIHEKEIECRLYAAPEYIKKFGMPKNLEDLSNNHYICNKRGLENYLPKWAKFLENAQHVIYTTNTIFGLRNVIRQGLGISIAPVMNSEGTQEITTIKFKDKLKVYLYAHEKTKNFPKNKVMIEFLSQQMDKCKGYK